MAERDPRCIYLAQDQTTATVVADLLIAHGFPVEVVSGGVLGQVDDSLGFNETLPPGLEIRLTDPSQIEAATALISTKQAELTASLRKQRNITGPLTAVCEECGKSSEWAVEEMGTTQDCPHCGSYLDVPDPDVDWKGLDFGAEDEEEDQP